VADFRVPARIRRLRIEDRQPLPGLSVVEAERRLDLLSAGDGLMPLTGSPPGWPEPGDDLAADADPAVF
jgi:hypothetical protein